MMMGRPVDPFILIVLFSGRPKTKTCNLKAKGRYLVRVLFFCAPIPTHTPAKDVFLPTGELKVRKAQRTRKSRKAGTSDGVL